MKEPANPMFHYHYGMALFRRATAAGAKKELEQALQLKPSRDDEQKIRDLLQRICQLRIPMKRRPSVKRSPSVPYVGPFAVFVGLLAVRPHSAPAGSRRSGAADRAFVDPRPFWLSRAACFWIFGSATGPDHCCGCGGFRLWIGPDLPFPGYRHLWLFSNPVIGQLHSRYRNPPRPVRDPVAPDFPGRADCSDRRRVVLARVADALADFADFEKVPLGAYQAASFWMCAVLFASEHGSYWDVGLFAGIIYNWWMVRTRSLGDLILTHAVTNACLSAYVIAAGKWEYWL